MKKLTPDQLKELIDNAFQYANAPTNPTYSVGDFRLIYNVGNSDFQQLSNDAEGGRLIKLIEEKCKLSIRVRLLNPDIKPAEVNAIRAFIEMEEGIKTQAQNTINISFAKNAEELANVLQEEENEEN